MGYWQCELSLEEERALLFPLLRVLEDLIVEALPIRQIEGDMRLARLPNFLEAFLFDYLLLLLLLL